MPGKRLTLTEWVNEGSRVIRTRDNELNNIAIDALDNLEGMIGATAVEQIRKCRKGEARFNDDGGSMVRVSWDVDCDAGNCEGCEGVGAFTLAATATARNSRSNICVDDDLSFYWRLIKDGVEVDIVDAYGFGENLARIARYNQDNSVGLQFRQLPPER